MYRQNPFTLRINYTDIPRAELREYFRHFVASIPARVILLRMRIHQDDAFASWVADETPDSLNELGSWFLTRVSTRPETESERAKIEATAVFPASIPDDKLTDETFSLAADIGMYFAQVITRLHPHLKWKQPLGSKMFVDYGQAVLDGFRGGMMLNPVRVVTNIAWAQSRGQAQPRRLRQLLEVWSSYVNTVPETRSH